MVDYINGDNARVDSLNRAKRELARAERASDPKRYFLIWEKYDALLRGVDGVDRNEELYNEGRRAAEHKARGEALLRGMQPGADLTDRF